MDLRDLRYFAAIARSGSMTAAAKALHVSQPTLTVAMQHLEEELATQLFVRERSGALRGCSTSSSAPSSG
ncbi:MAG: LysR family transcriptional regulator [Myxococcales bacterium]|nr:LysR family transcriptional regulator [Myxococcales bacterium]